MLYSKTNMHVYIDRYLKDVQDRLVPRTRLLISTRATLCCEKKIARSSGGGCGESVQVALVVS